MWGEIDVPWGVPWLVHGVLDVSARKVRRWSVCGSQIFQQDRQAGDGEPRECEFYVLISSRNIIMRELAPQFHIPWSIPTEAEDIPIVPTTSGTMWVPVVFSNECPWRLHEGQSANTVRGTHLSSISSVSPGWSFVVLLQSSGMEIVPRSRRWRWKLSILGKSQGTKMLHCWEVRRAHLLNQEAQQKSTWKAVLFPGSIQSNVFF